MAAKKKAEVSIPRLNVETVELTLVGTSPLIQHAWDPKIIRLMAEKQAKKAKKGREAKVPAYDWVASMYWLSDPPVLPLEDPDEAMEVAEKAVQEGRFGMKTIAFKAAAVYGAGYIDGLTKVSTRGAFHVVGEYAEIDAEPPVMRQDMVRVGVSSADIRYRGMFEEWSTTLTIQLNTAAMSIEQMVSLFNTGGFSSGVGEWRPEKNGSYGRFTVK